MFGTDGQNQQQPQQQQPAGQDQSRGGFFSSIMNHFGAQPKNDAPTIVVQAPAPVTPEEPKPDFLTTLFTPAETDAKPAQFDPNSLLTMDPKQVNEAVSKMNFFEGVDPKLIETVRAGGDDAVKAQFEIMQQGMRNAFSSMMQVSGAMTTKAFSNATPHIDQRISGTLRDRDVRTAISEVNPFFSSPAGQFMADSLAKGLQAKYPNASMEDIKRMTGEFIKETTGKLSPQQEQQQQQSSQSDTNWGSYLTGPNGVFGS